MDGKKRHERYCVWGLLWRKTHEIQVLRNTKDEGCSHRLRATRPFLIALRERARNRAAPALRGRRLKILPRISDGLMRTRASHTRDALLTPPVTRLRPRANPPIARRQIGHRRPQITADCSRQSRQNQWPQGVETGSSGLSHITEHGSELLSDFCGAGVTKARSSNCAHSDWQITQNRSTCASADGRFSVVAAGFCFGRALRTTNSTGRCRRPDATNAKQAPSPDREAGGARKRSTAAVAWAAVPPTRQPDARGS